MLNKSGKSGHPCLVPDLGRKTFNLSLLSMMLAVGLSYMAFITLRYAHSVPNLFRGFIMNRFEIYLMLFCVSIDDHMIFSLLLMCVSLLLIGI